MQETFTYDDTYSKPMFDRGFTGHEHLTAFGLINMNGRMYDPVMSSFLSADRYVQDPTSAQGFNRYAYCMYNPLRFVDPSGWLMGGGNGHQPDGPLPRVMINNQAHYVIPETTITASPAPFTANTFNNEFVFTPNPSSDGITQWYYWSNYGPSNGHNGGSGSSGNHGGASSVNQGYFSDLSPIISCEGIVIGYKQQQWLHPQNRTQKAINQRKAYEIQKSLKSKGISKQVKDIKAGKAANLGRASKGVAALGIGLEVYDVINNEKIMPSNILNTTITTISIWCWPIGGIYLITDIGVLLITGQSIGEHLDEWIGEPVIDFNKP